MDQQLKYSVSAAPAVLTFLVSNGINFVCRRGIQSRKRRIFFITDPETAAYLSDFTGYNVSDEMDGWDFDGWKVIQKR